MMIDKIVNFARDYPFYSLGLTFLFIFSFQSLNIFYGFELLDSGFHLTAYENIFDAPDSVSYNFMYYLTNVIGGIIMKIFPCIGVVGFRIVGALFVDCAILLIFLCLRKDIPVIHLLFGGVLVVLSYIQIPYSFNNGICSCFLYVCAILVLYKGLVNEKVTLILLGGIIVGINIFSRIPNLLAVGLVLITLFHRYIENGKLNYDWRSTLFFVLGVLIGITSIAIMIVLLGHQHAFIETLHILFQKGTSSSDTHSAGTLIWVQIYFYLNAVIPAALFFAILCISKLLEEKSPLLRVLFIGVASLVMLYHVYLNFGNEPLWAMCAVGCLWGMCRRGQLALLASLAMFMLIVEIMGSNSGYNHGSLPALLAAPVASFIIINRKCLYYIVVVCLALFIKVVKQGNFFDIGPLYMKKSSIYVKECSLIKTTAVRAEAMNVSLPILKKYIYPKDTLLVFGSAPIINYLTHTRPAGGMCWPGEGFFVKPFETAPKILIHKFGDFTEPTIQTFGIPTRNQMINTYMHDHQYKIVWENSYFILLFPQK